MVTFLITFILAMVIVIITCLDILKKISLLNKSFIIIYLIFLPHIVLLGYYFNVGTKFGQDHPIFIKIILFEAALFFLYIWMKVNIVPYKKKEIVNMRLRIMIGGRQLVIYGLYTAVAQGLIYIITFKKLEYWAVPNYIFNIDIIVVVLAVVSLLLNGMIRILCTSRRLNILRRIIVASMMFIPVVNIFVMLYVCHIATIEYDHECYKVINHQARVDSQICKTKYPLLLVHGVGFRDLKYRNYWGRIPKELIRNGATIYYGNQEAWGTIEYNAEDIKNKILQIIKETGCEKVNIIAHSKGGLDARYTVSKLGMSNFVASLTMISSPHRGCKFIDIICKMPDKVFKALAKFMDNRYRFFGDKNPDFYTASRQFLTDYSKKFNEEVEDKEGVYYQSYMTVMKNMFSDFVLTIPYIFVKLTEGENDGLVSIESARWGEFRGILRNKRRRGISHGDIIDLRRDDYKDFDVIEKYVEIVSELKVKGF